MTNLERQQGKLTRRAFLKSTALTAGAMAAASALGCASADTSGSAAGKANAGEKTYVNMCRGNCGGSCPQVATVREGKIVRAVPHIAPEGSRESQLGCVKGQSTPQRVYSTRRVLHPMKQTGEKGSDAWEQISWDEAIALVSEKFQTAIKDYGPASVAFWLSFGSKSYLSGLGPVMLNGPARPSGTKGLGAERFIQKIGASVLTASSDMTGIFMASGLLNFPMSSVEDLANAKTILIWGANPAEAWRPAWPWICKARENGATIVTIDPVYTPSAALSDIWVPVKAGTDSALMLAMCNYVMEKDLVDYDYLKNKSVAPLLIKEDGTYLKLSEIGMDPVDVNGTATDTEVVYDEAAGVFGSSFAITNPAIEGEFEVEGIKVRPVFGVVKENIGQFTVDFAAKECGISRDQIIQIAELYASNGPSTINNYWGFEHLANTFHNYKSLMLLASLTGNLCKPGAGVHHMLSASTAMRSAIADTSDIAVEGALPNYSITGEYLVEIMETGKWAGQDFPIRCIYVSNANPLSSGLGRTAVTKAFREVDFTVVADSFMTDTARNANLVLPIALSWECEDHDGNFLMQKAVEPLGECRTDMDVFRALADKMGFPELYSKTDEEYLRTFLGSEESVANGTSYDDYKEVGYIPEYKNGSVAGVERNATGRSQFYLQKVIPRDYYGQTFELKDRIPYYEKAAEAFPGNPLEKKYPLHGISRHLNYNAHGLFNGIAWLDELRGEPYVEIHADAAAARGIKQGDTVRVFNDRGYVVLKALVTQGIRPDTVLLPHGPEQEDYIDGHAQSLTLLVLDPVTSNNNYNDLLCEVELYEGGAQ